MKNPFHMTGPIETDKWGRQFFLIGPDGLVWHRSYGPQTFDKLAEELNRAFELGRAEGGRS